ncbi:phospholipid scramblase 2-like isoform X2 [Prorops nasuta]|uniref:phospholipid scramblase 2-like isoform X2 n=1 Tax=Prorops nasuta TaxID=863751 RepID=UPI0034D02086
MNVSYYMRTIYRQLRGGWQLPNTTCPPGLQYLMSLDSLIVNQKLEFLEAITGWETKNKYNVANANGETVFFVKEQSSCLSRTFCGSQRECEFHVMDASMRQVLTITRPFRCTRCCYPCCLQEMEVYSQGNLLGSVIQEWTLWRPLFSIKNAFGDTVLKIEGPLFRCCVDVSYQILSTDGRRQVGQIRKKWSGIAREFLTDTDFFAVHFPLDLDVSIKAVLLGACLLIDFMYFEH